MLAALHMRHRTGTGQAVEVSMAESTLMVNDLSSAELLGEDPQTGFRAGQNWSSIFRLSTGRHVNVTLDATTDGGFDTWVRAMDAAALRSDARFATAADRVANRAALDAEIGAWVAGFASAAELERAIGVSTVLAAEVRTVPELAASDWANERQAFVPIDVGQGSEVVVPQSPWRFSDADSGVRPIVGFRGEHNREVLARVLGLDDDTIDRLAADGVISDRIPGWKKA